MAILNLLDFGEDSLSALVRAMSASSPGDEIFVPRGVYEIREGIQYLRSSDIKIIGEPGTIFKASDTSTTQTALRFQNQTNVAVSGIEFKDVNLMFVSGANITVHNNSFNNTGFGYNDDPVRIIACHNFNVTDNKIHRTGLGGRCIVAVQSYDGLISNNIGTGTLKTGVNVSGNIGNTNGKYIYIRNNTFIRDDCEQEDHGMYLQTAQHVSIDNNHIEGWSTDATGWALKLRNSDEF